MGEWTREQESSFRDRTLRILSGRSHSRKELADKLAKRQCPRALIELLLTEMTRYGYLDDLVFAESFAREKIRAGWGARRISVELLKRGISSTDIDKVIGDNAAGLAGEGEFARACELAERRFRLGKSPNSTYAFLMRRGFSGACSARAVSSCYKSSSSLEADI